MGTRQGSCSASTVWNISYVSGTGHGLISGPQSSHEFFPLLFQPCFSQDCFCGPNRWRFLTEAELIAESQQGNISQPYNQWAICGLRQWLFYCSATFANKKNIPDGKLQTRAQRTTITLEARVSLSWVAVFVPNLPPWFQAHCYSMHAFGYDCLEVFRTQVELRRLNLLHIPYLRIVYAVL